MSVNITVNGKFAKHCKPHPLLQDPVKARKDEEQERRKIRLLQVREQSKKFAEKIRNDVKESMHKEKQKYERTKAEELNCWRHHALQEKMNDYRTAVFQIGTAHMAAKTENREKAEKKDAKTQGSYKQFRKQMAARQKKRENLKDCGPCICSKIQVQCTCGQPVTQKLDEPQKRKRDSCFSSCDSESSTDDETSSGETLNDSSISSCVMPSATTTTSCHNRATQTSLNCISKNLKKTPAVFLDVEVGSEDSIIINAPTEIKDKHSEYNQQYSSIIRVSPRKTRKTQDIRQMQVARTPSLSSERSREKLQETTKASEDNSKVTNQPIARAVREKRFTLISDLLKKQQDNSVQPETTSPTRSQQPAYSHSKMSPNKSKDTTLTATRPPVSRPMSQAITPKASPRKGSASSKSSQFVAGGQKRPSVSISAASGNTLALGSSSSTSGRVQFYDYNSKLCKDGVQEQTSVTVNRQRETLLPSAMEQAAMENRLQQEMHHDMLKKNKQMEERGIKALEREQVRRDCNDLNEKIEALTRQYPRQLPTNDNVPHIFVDKQLRKEVKMNTAVENLLSRPNIITCSEVSQKRVENIATTSKPLSANNFCNEINVGLDSNVNHLPTKDVSSDSCCSILLGYVDDQSRQVRRDLEEWPYSERNEKQTRLRNLLVRLDKMRDTLVQELKIVQKDVKEKEQTYSKGEQFENLIDSISKCRQEREDIMIDSIVQKGQREKATNQREGKDKSLGPKQQSRHKEQRPLDEREKVLQLKEDLLEKKLREFYELQKQQKSSKRKDADFAEPMENVDNDQSENKENINCTALETPVEIVITVKGESKCITIPGKSTRKTPSKRKPPPRATLIKSPQPAKNITPRKKPSANKQATGKVLGRQNSYDSNSTSYMSLPPQIPNELGNMVDNLQHQSPDSTTENTPTSLEFDDDNEKSRSKEPVKNINPLVAQYVQRLLGMSRKAVERLGISSTDIETPSSSIINTTDNVVSQDSLVSEERMALVESFMQENRSFIKELEQSLRANNNSTMGNSMKVLDDIWRKRLKQNKQSENKSKPKHKASNHKFNAENQILSKDKSALEKHQSKEVTNKNEKDQRKVNAKQSQQRTLLAPRATQSRRKSTEVCRDDFNSSPEILAREKRTSHYRSAEKNDKAVGTGTSAELKKPEADTQIARYAQLTENCTHRIAELTELISRVRQEKQRLLEVTLSSVSDNGRQSTEYLDLPNGKSHTTNEPAETSAASSSDDALQNKKSLALETLNQMPKLSALEKNRHITASQDSGIAESRPITAQENCNDVEPTSHTSTESQGINLHQRKLKPPAVLRRFSPQLQEDELVHELSTILEVDTPANSRINTAVGQTSSEDRLAATETLNQPVIFPTFMQYVQQLNLDITRLDAEQSTQLQHEFSLYIEDLQKSQGQENPQYTAFPSINTYMSSATAEHNHPDIIDESLGQMRINSIAFERFPDVRGYVQQQRNKPFTTSPNDEPQLLDTESLENITDLPTNSNTDNDNDTASLDIEQELKRRNILKKSFRQTQSNQIFSSTAHQDGEFYNEIIAAESGVEKLSTSGTTMTLLEADMRKLVRKWPTNAANKGKQQYQVLSSTTTSTKETTKDKGMKSTSLEESSNELGRPLNLHDFLKRELLKHANISDSTTSSSSDFSLRSQFLYSLIGTLTPGTNAATSKSGQQTLERQKTSTPVPIQSSHSHSTPSNPSRTSSSQLFSGESRISSVHLCDPSHRLQNTSEGVNGDQSSN